MTSENSKRRYFLSLVFIAKSISKKLLTPPDIYTKWNMKAIRKQATINIRIIPLVLQDIYWNHLWEFVRWYWRICMYLEMSNEEASIRLDVTLVIAWINSSLSKNLSSILLERILLCVVCITSPRCCSIRDAVSKPLSVSFKWKKTAPY